MGALWFLNILPQHWRDLKMSEGICGSCTREKNISILCVCLPPKYSYYSNLGRLFLLMYPHITSGCPTPGSPPNLCYSPFPFHSLLWNLNSRGRWTGEVHDSGSYPPMQSTDEKRTEKNPKREERQGFIKQERAANVFPPFLLCTFLRKAFL